MFDDSIINPYIRVAMQSVLRKDTEIARRMVTKFGMSEELGLINYDSNNEEVFVGRDFAQAGRGYADEH